MSNEKAYNKKPKMLRIRKSRIAILFFVTITTTWLGPPRQIMNGNTTRSLKEEGEARAIYTYQEQIDEEVDPSIKTAIFETVKRNAEEKKESDEDSDGATLYTNSSIMHTFYKEMPGGCCGMTGEGHQKLLQTWIKSWEERGWETKVLTKDDAMKHPDFEMLEENLQRLGVSEHNRICYWRWLAMANEEGGGWMSDYDVFPLQLTPNRGKEIAQDGTFKSFGWHVPCLIHASRENWDRIIHRMIDELPNQRDSPVISDMNSLLKLNKAGVRSEMQWSNEISKNFIYSRNEFYEQYIDCDKGQKLAVHLSPAECDAALRNGRFPLDGIKNTHEAVRERAEAAAVLMEDYKNHCLAKES